MTFLSELKSILSTERKKHDVYDENPNFITRPNRIHYMLRKLVASNVHISVVLNDQSEYTSRISDVLNDSFLLDPFNDKDGHNKITTNSIVHINAKQQAVHFKFNTVILKPNAAFGAGYIAALPEKIYYPQKRAFFRLPLDAIGKYSVNAAIQFSENEVTGYLYDIGYGGACIAVQSTSYVKKGDILSPSSLRLKNGLTVHVDLTVCSVKRNPREGFTRLGCEFLNLEAESKRHVHKFITECERERAKNQINPILKNT
ncbi:MAG: flagellar brake protein [Cycloclasticus sp.]|nr:flagellar brake protein [Cycloclasticus sp.]MBQ0789601.1 flagellar brake protein [Cycloclasticus sp.]